MGRFATFVRFVEFGENGGLTNPKVDPCQAPCATRLKGPRRPGPVPRRSRRRARPGPSRRAGQVPRGLSHLPGQSTLRWTGRLHPPPDEGVGEPRPQRRGLRRTPVARTRRGCWLHRGARLDLYRDPDPFRIPAPRSSRHWPTSEFAVMMSGGFGEPLAYSRGSRRSCAIVVATSTSSTTTSAWVRAS
jgi:hypothetical protein